MFKQGLILSSLIFFVIACKEKPYSEPLEVPAPKQTDYSFNGIVELGTPISGATVSAYKFDGLRQGEKIAQVINSPDGTFDLKFHTDYEGPILLSARGGLYRDLVTNEMIALKPSQELRSAITHIKMPEKTNINAWTTLAIARVQADRGFWDKGVAELKDIDRINVDFSQVSYFLTGKSPNFVNIRRQEFFDAGKDGFKPDDPKVTLHLAHGGLSELASGFSAKLAEEGIVISVMDLVLALVDDLSDRIFDGRNASGSVVYVGNNHRINLDSYTMRKNLSEAIVLYSKHLEALGKMSKENVVYLEMPDQLVDNIARDARPELFPGAEVPKPVDKNPPSIQAHFAGPHSLEDPYPVLTGNVFLEIAAHDDTKVQEVRLLEPVVLGPKSMTRLGPIFVNVKPQAMYAAEVCGKQAELKSALKKMALEDIAGNLICVCVEAIDVFGNAQKALKCFQRPALSSIIKFPTNKTVLSSKNFSDGIKIKAEITSGLPITKCSWQIATKLDPGFDEDILPSGKGLIEGTTCSIDESLDGSKFFDGSYFLVLNAEDLGGRILSDKQDGMYQSVVNFQVSKEPPVVDVLRPANNDYIKTPFIEVAGRVLNPSLVESIEFKITGIGKPLDEISLTSRAIIDQSSGTWGGVIGDKLPAGRFSFDLIITDIYGNKKSIEARTITIDLQTPTIMGALEGVQQITYLQETNKYRQRFVNEKNNPHYVIEPAGEAAPIKWGQPPSIYRWSTRLDDVGTAPVYIVKANDDNRLREVRYKLNFECSALDKTAQIVEAQEGLYKFQLAQRFASFNLSRDSEADGHKQKYCLSIWAVDQAGNIANHNVEFIWKVVPAPASVDMNAKHYLAHRNEDDITSISQPMWELFYIGDPIRLKKDLVIGHAIMANPYSVPISSSLALTKPMNLIISSGNYQIPARIIGIKFFEYDLAKDKVGEERTLRDKSVLIKSKETVLAKFVLLQDFSIEDISYPNNDFWKSLRIAVGFSNSGGDKPLVDGLRLIMRDVSTGKLSNDFVVSWGENHVSRRRTPTRLAS